MNIVRLAGAATVVCLGTFWFVMAKRDRRKNKEHVEQIPDIT